MRQKRMRQLRRLLSVLVMAVTMVGMSATVFAQESVSGAGGNGSITIENASKGIHYTIYKIFDEKKIFLKILILKRIQREI